MQKFSNRAAFYLFIPGANKRRFKRIVTHFQRVLTRFKELKRIKEWFKTSLKERNEFKWQKNIRNNFVHFYEFFFHFFFR